MAAFGVAVLVLMLLSRTFHSYWDVTKCSQTVISFLTFIWILGSFKSEGYFFLSMQTFIYPFGSFSHFDDVKGHGNPNDNKIFCFSRSSLYFVFHGEIRAPNIQTSASLFTVILNQITKYPMVRPGLIKKFNVLSHIYVF